MPNSLERRMESLLATVDIAHSPIPEGLEALGLLVDMSCDLARRDSLDVALRWAETLEKRPLTPAQEMTLHFFRGNAWLEKHKQSVRCGDRDNQDWSQPELGSAILALRTVLMNESFGSWSRIRQAQLYTNLGNALSTLGRALDAIAYRDSALSLIPRFGMASGTRAESIDAFRGTLYRHEDRQAYILAAAEGFAAATAPDAVYETAGYLPIINKWKARYHELQAWLIQDPTDRSEFVAEPPTRERLYRTWCLEKRLVLNPLNDLGSLDAASADSLHLPPIAPHDDRARLLFGYLDTMKQQYCFARGSFYESLKTRRPHFSDETLVLHDTGDHPLLGLSVERIKSAYLHAYSLFDKIALFINVYFEARIPASNVTFSKLWCKTPGVLRSLFASANNWPLRGLYWISRDLAEPNFRDVIEPDAQALAELRNYIEHRFVRVVEKYGDSGRGGQGLIYLITLSDLERRALTILRLVRSALIMLVSAVYVEEYRRGPGRGAWTVLPRL